MSWAVEVSMPTLALASHHLQSSHVCVCVCAQTQKRETTRQLVASDNEQSDNEHMQTDTHPTHHMLIHAASTSTHTHTHMLYYAPGIAGVCLEDKHECERKGDGLEEGLHSSNTQHGPRVPLQCSAQHSTSGAAVICSSGKSVYTTRTAQE